MKLNLLTLAVVLAAAIFFAAQMGYVTWTPRHIIGIAIVVPSLLLFVTARLQLGSAFSLEAKASKLVSTGLYSRIRNPIYVFGALMVLGVIVFAGQPWWLAIYAVLIPMQMVRARKESQVLEQKFGDEYREYKKKTWF
jgi:protein-S-isoprenylcysteine O-methyltransferase Ste14